MTRPHNSNIFHIDENVEATLVFCDSGWGDGEFTVYELLDDDSRSGVEIEMMDEQNPIPDWVA